MPKRIELFDWSATPLGPKVDWSTALRTTYDMMMGTGFATCATWGPDQTLIYNAAYVPFLGKRHPSALGRPIQEVWHDVWDDICPLLDKAMSGESVYVEDLHLVMSRNGYPEDTYWTFSYGPLRDGDSIEGVLDIAIDTTARIAAERTNVTLMAETTHRLKNTLAVVQGMAKQSLRGLSDPGALDGFEQRLLALAAAHDVLHLRDWKSADLEALIDVALSRLIDRSRYELAGPSFQIAPQVAQTFSLVIHELATNAIKHGAWSSPEGQVTVTWRRIGPEFQLEWCEVGGPAVTPPARTSLGARLIRGGFAGSGGAEMDFAEDGLTVRFKAAAADVVPLPDN